MKRRNRPIVLEVVRIQRELFEQWLKYSLFKYSRHPTSFQGKVDNLVYYWENRRKQTLKYMTMPGTGSKSQELGVVEPMILKSSSGGTVENMFSWQPVVPLSTAVSKGGTWSRSRQIPLILSPKNRTKSLAKEDEESCFGYFASCVDEVVYQKLRKAISC